MKRIVCLILVCMNILIISVSANDNVYVPILMYHNINDNYNPEQSAIEMSREDFANQLNALKESGYNTITFQQYLNYEEKGDPLPENPILINFDDGYLNNYTVAYPILKEMGMKATIFIITSRMGMTNGVKYPHFTWKQAKEMEDSGVISIESHTNYHNNLRESSLITSILEVRKSKYLIKKNLGKDSTIIAFPYGDFTEYVKQEVKKAGYKAAVKVKLGMPGVNRKGQDLFELKRLTVYGGMSGQDLLKLIEDNKDY